MIVDKFFKIDIDKKRHIAKAITWRIVGSLDTLLLTWLITGELKYGALVSGFETINKIILYYVHERVWYKINWGIKHERKHSPTQPPGEERGPGDGAQPER